MIQTVIFDLGGVLVRTEDQDPRRTLAERHGLTYQGLNDLVYGSESAERATWGEIPADQHKETVLRELGLPPGTFSDFGKEFWGGDLLDSKLVDFIQSLRGEYRTALLSNAWDDLRPLLIDLWKIDGIFDEIFISAELKLAKPDPRIYQHVIKALDADPSTLIFVDDFIENIEGARAGGIHAVHFRSREQALADLTEYLDTDLSLS
jgi:putative hydrolase of the HAD superfamily